jgi:hypothetical protein
MNLKKYLMIYFKFSWMAQITTKRCHNIMTNTHAYVDDYFYY